MRYPNYPKYKESGVEWLGEVPEHWEIKRIGSLFRFKSGGTPDTSKSELWEGDIPWVSAKDMKRLLLEDTEDHISEESIRTSATSLVPRNSLMILTRSGILRHSLPVAVLSREMAINQDIKGCIPIGSVNPLFVAYQISGNQNALLALWRQQGATVESLDVQSIKICCLATPPYREQEAIVGFLNARTGQLDLLVKKKLNLIEALRERRAALISHTLTRGLPPEVAQKAGLELQIKFESSGVDWLGEIPGHWKIERLGRHVDLMTGFPFKSESFSFDQGTRLVRGDNVTEGQLRWGDKTRYWIEPTKELKQFYLQGGDIVIGMDGSKVGKNYAMVKDSDLPLLLVQRVARLRAMPSISRQFLFRLIGSLLFRAWVDIVKTDPAIPHISPHDICGFLIPLPPLEEQRAIADYLDCETAKIDRMITKVEEAIERLREYRAALITAAVTGKIDVREAAV